MGVLKAWVNGAWEEATGATTNEVFVGATDPRASGTVFKNVQIWFDTTLPAGQRMKVWDPATSAWVAAVAGASGDFLPLAGGTLTGNLTLNGTNLGVNFTGGSGIYAWTDKPLTLREGTNGSQPKIINNDGGGGRDIIDTVNGDARYLQIANPAAGTNYNVSWQNSFSGTCAYRVNSTTVTCSMINVGLPSDSAEPARLKLHDYPSGVPAPWMNFRIHCSFIDDSNKTWWNSGEVQFQTDGVWLQVFDNRRLGSAESFSAACTWPR